MTLANLFQWCIQVGLITLAAAIALRMIRIEAPVLRHGFWRVLLAVGLVLPIVQPWAPAPTPITDSLNAAIVSAPSGTATTSVSAAQPSAPAMLGRFVAGHWLAWIGFVLAAGVAIRFAWLFAGILRLRRLCKAGQVASLDGEYDDLVTRIRARAEVRYVPRIGQPVTFGLFRPIVLLPDRFPTLDPMLRRTVLAHELWHVKRRDWGWVLLEESIRAVMWFNPAVSWLVSKVQSTREEVVDELTVQLTNARKAYLEALLLFADEPTLFPAAPLARRRHLFHRMLLISREAVMSSRRILTSFAAAAIVVAGAGWYGVSAFPLTAEPQSSAQAPARDRRPGEAAPETSVEREVQARLQANPSRDLYFQLIELQKARGAYRDLDVTIDAVQRAYPRDAQVYTRLSQIYNGLSRFEDAIAMLQHVAAIDATNPQTQQIIATYYWEKAFKDASLTPQQRFEYTRAGIAATDKALELNPDYVDALVYKNILLRMEAQQNPANSAALIAEADALRTRALELQRARSGARGGVAGGVPGGVPGGVAGGVARSEMAFSPAPGQAPPPPPPPPPPPVTVDGETYQRAGAPQQAPPPEFVDGVRALRVGGNIKAPRKIRDVKPVYPPIAQQAGVQGVVIIEAVIDSLGNIYSARVLRGAPLLDEAALQAVQGWQFEPTQINGVPAPIVMTVTVNFTLDK